MSRRSALIEINKLKDLRWDLERARMLCDLVRKRERLRRSHIDLKVAAVETLVEVREAPSDVWGRGGECALVHAVVYVFVCSFSYARARVCLLGTSLGIGVSLG